MLCFVFYCLNLSDTSIDSAGFIHTADIAPDKYPVYYSNPAKPGTQKTQTNWK